MKTTSVVATNSRTRDDEKLPTRGETLSHGRPTIVKEIAINFLAQFSVPSKDSATTRSVCTLYTTPLHY